ncbi:hypothetical protein NT6N_32690 [Oceaniferula spumae]|uniref:Antitoxin n=1 Tax=Oceaniferula spumae TaxID=2979115 RepID=A0AAT9FQF3_9BACT
MKTIGLYDAKTKLSALIAEIEASGETIQLTRHGKVVAELSPPTPVSSPVRGCLKSANFSMADDFDASETGFEDFFNADDDQTPSMVAENKEKYES